MLKCGLSSNLSGLIMRFIIPLLLAVSLPAQAESYSCSWMTKNDDKPWMAKVEVSGEDAEVLISNRHIQGAEHDFKVLKNGNDELL